MSRSNSQCRTAAATLVCIALCALVWTGCQEDDSPVVARYGNSTLTLDEFERRYTQSVGSAAQSHTDSLSQYLSVLDQHINHQLKLRFARDKKLQHDSTFRHRVEEYRRKLAKSYVVQDSLESLARRLYQRRQHELKVSWLLVPIPPNSQSQDTLQAYRKISALVDSLNAGASFEQLARHTRPPFDGDIGYGSTRGNFPLEDLAYRLSEGERSAIRRTPWGYAVIQVHDRRNKGGHYELSHFLARPGQTSSDSSQTVQLLSAIRDSALHQEDTFAEIATRHEERGQSKSGTMRNVSLGKLRSMSPKIANAVSKLDSVGAITEVVSTQYGLHLFQLTGKTPPPSFEEQRSDLVQQVRNTPRGRNLRDSLAERGRSRYETEVDTSAVNRLWTHVAPTPSWAELKEELSRDSIRHVSFARLGDFSFSFGQLGESLPVSSDQTVERQVLWQEIDEFLDRKAFTQAALEIAKRSENFQRELEQFRKRLLLSTLDSVLVKRLNLADTAAARQFHRRTVSARPTDPRQVQPTMRQYQTAQMRQWIEELRNRCGVKIDTTVLRNAFEGQSSR